MAEDLDDEIEVTQVSAAPPQVAVDLEDETEGQVQMPTSAPKARTRRQVPPRAAAVFCVESDSESSSSSGRSRSRERKQQVGAAAATALLTSTQPLDIDEAERLIEQELAMPTSFAVRLQHEGGAVALMAEHGVNMTIKPRDDMPEESIISIAGTALAVGRTLSALELEYTKEQQAKALAAEMEEIMAQVAIPSEHMSATIGANGSALAEVRARCGGLMIALQPSETPGGPFTAHIGPGQRRHVVKAEKELRERLLEAELAKAAAADVELKEPQGTTEAAKEVAEAPEASAASEAAESMNAD